MMTGYIEKMRLKIGQETFIHPAARIIIENDDGEYLFIERLDTGMLGIPAGSIEEGECIEDCIKREVKEETGLEIVEMDVIGISSNPEIESVVYPNGDKIQYFTIEFYSRFYRGKIQPMGKYEVKKAMFMDKTNISKVPVNERSTFTSLEFFRREGRILVK